MVPIRFHPQEQLLQPPVNSNVLPLPVLLVTYQDGDLGSVSCWQPSWWEMMQILWRRRVYLTILGNEMPPALLSASPFLDGLELMNDEELSATR